MTKTTRARRATALTAAVVAVAGTVAVAIAEPSAAYSATGTIRVASDVFPVVTSISPLMGAPDGGTPVTIVGSGFQDIDTDNLSTVLFGDVPATGIWVVSDTKLVATAPPGTGNVLVKVVTDAGTSKNVTSMFGYRLKLSADFDSVTAKATGGAEIPVTVSGATVGSTASQFAALKVTAKVGGIPTTKVTWVDDTHVKVVVPATTRAVPSKLQLVQDGFTGPESTATVNYAPVITSVTPGAVAVAGGDTIRIVGSGFGGVDPKDPDAVTVGGVDASYFQVVSAGQIDAVVPAGAAAGYAAVKVTAPGGASAEAARIAYRSALTFAGDQYLRANGGVHLLTVTGGTLGANLADYAAAGISVRMGASKLTATYVDATHLRVTLPVLTTDSLALTIYQETVAGPVATIPVAPVVTSLSAVSDTVGGGSTVKVKVAGPGVTTASNFLFGTYAAVCPGSGSGSGLVFTCVVPAAAAAGPVWVRFTSGSGTASRFTPAASFSYTDID
ncbi:Hepatocyte growth factor receptor [Actinoplanes sp. SE50]|uniref:IPT/TIG domain-containing protein n=1 Tax=unclassified Actinoplanes TaxID=2626549 RepID=UPI00023EC90C|nr:MULTISPECIES: IPT/TIG domain-containing protein [unclassified Actinoplanes]AEV82597.1 Hepatocyte growth factor receptor [Actinoplanes sp. SE50/110]ATO80993.1 Hepatocyte growth factor receptor [Actinoplanes sp. SE50]SLL98400.1 Hepatocyte growth factor receptor [Actinoplanes sp. SE50/110]